MKPIRMLAVTAFMLAVLSPCLSQAADRDMREISVSSPAFKAGGVIPARYTCAGENLSPPLSWKGVPSNARSVVLIADDPDAPMGTWVHWVIYDIPHRTAGLKEGVSKGKKPPCGGIQGINGFRNFGYDGPCPPSGTHRYFFKVYALDKELGDIPGGGGKKEVIKAMEGHVVAEGVLMGLSSK